MYNEFRGSFMFASVLLVLSTSFSRKPGQSHLTNQGKHADIFSPIRIRPKPRHLSYSRFSALGTGCMLSRAWLHVFLHLAPIVCFPALCTGCSFILAWHRLRVFPRLETVTCFPALGAGCMFPVLGTGCMFSRAWSRLFVFPQLGSGFMFLQRLLINFGYCFTTNVTILIFSSNGTEF